MIKEFGAFCERAGCPNLLTARFFDPAGSFFSIFQDNELKSIRWLDFGRLREITFRVPAPLVCGFSLFFKNVCHEVAKDQIRDQPRV